LRLAVLFKYVALAEDSQPFQLSVNNRSLNIIYPRGWLQSHPLTRIALEREKNLLAKKGIALSVDRSA